MKKRILATTTLFTILMSHNLYAGKFEIIGEGVSTVPAEFVKIDIQIKSECFSSASGARKEVDRLTHVATKALESFKTDFPEQLSVSPEGNSQSIKTVYINGQQTVVCDQDHSWSSQTHLQFKLTDLNKLSSLQDQLLNLNSNSEQEQGSINAKNKETVVLSLQKLTPGVTSDTWDLMNDKALLRAQENALRQVKVLTANNPNVKIELAKVTAAPSGSSGQLIYDRINSEGDSSGVSLGSVSLKLARQFTFKID